MKKYLVSIRSLIIAIAFLFTITATAGAGAPPTPSLSQPVVTPVSGDMEFTTEFIPIAQFPGTTEFNQMLVPVGFPAGEAQYQGDGIIVTGMDSGKATACFTISGTQYGWGGKVGVWNGTKWVLLPTTIKALDESPNSLACAPITGNGTYVFIRYVAEPDKLPKVGAECEFAVEMYPTGYTTIYQDLYTQGWMTGAMFVSDHVLTGMPITVRFLRSDPAGRITMDGTGTGIAFLAGPGTYGVLFDSFLWWTRSTLPIGSETYFVTFGGCFKEIEINNAN